MEIRAETPDDLAAVRSVNQAAFGRDNEADLVDALRRGAEPVLSWVAIASDQVVGHVLFTGVTVEGEGGDRILGLAPLAVLPAWQKQGIGTQLVNHALAECRRLGFLGVVVLGDPAYYGRFGFVAAKTYGLRCEYPVPDEVFMALELQPDGLQAFQGLVKYRPEFAAV